MTGHLSVPEPRGGRQEVGTKEKDALSPPHTTEIDEKTSPARNAEQTCPLAMHWNWCAESWEAKPLDLSKGFSRGRAGHAQGGPAAASSAFRHWGVAVRRLIHVSRTDTTFQVTVYRNIPRKTYGSPSEGAVQCEAKGGSQLGRCRTKVRNHRLVSFLCYQIKASQATAGNLEPSLPARSELWPARAEVNVRWQTNGITHRWGSSGRDSGEGGRKTSRGGLGQLAIPPGALRTQASGTGDRAPSCFRCQHLKALDYVGPREDARSRTHHSKYMPAAVRTAIPTPRTLGTQNAEGGAGPCVQTQRPVASAEDD